MNKIFHEAKFVIQNSTTIPKYAAATEDIQRLRKGDIIEIAFEEENTKGDYEVVTVDERWSMSDAGDETYWYNFTVKLVAGSLKPL